MTAFGLILLGIVLVLWMLYPKESNDEEDD